MTEHRPLADNAQQRWAASWGWAVIATAVIITYWPLTSFQWTLTHGDTLNCWLPWRWAISNALFNGEFPLWNPHQQFGYPLHADLQGPAWYVESLAIGGTIGHTIYSLQALYLFYLIVGGCGMMRLVRNLHGDPRIGTVVGCGYALGGFFTGHQMHFYAIISAAWLPWLFDAAWELMRTPTWRAALRAAIVQGLLLTGGNHTFTIIGSYVLAASFVCALWAYRSIWKRKDLSELFLWSTVAVVLAALIAAGPLHAWWESAPHLARASGLPYEAASVNPVSPRSLSSLLFPFATGTDQEYLGTDAPMANCYMGGLLLALAAAALFRKRTPLENMLLVMGVFCSIAALGDHTPIYRMVWRFVPGMDLFRFPAYFRWFSWFAALLLAAGTLKELWTTGKPRTAVLLTTATLCAAGFALVAFHEGPSGSEDANSLFEHMRTMGTKQRLLLSAAVPLPLLMLGAFLVRQRKLSFAWIAIIVLAEMGWSTSLAQWNTAVSDMSPSWIHDRLTALGHMPVTPRLEPTLAYKDSGQRLHYLSVNTRSYLGGYSKQGLNSFWLKNAMDLELGHPGEWQGLNEKPVVFMAQDTSGGFGSVQAVEFTPERFAVRTHSNRPDTVVLQQSRYPGWTVTVDGAPQPLRTIHVAAMGVVVPAGEHEVEFEYRKPIVPWLLAISLIALFGALFALAATSALPTINVTGALLLAMAVVWSLFAHTPKSERLESDVERLAAALPNDAAVVFNDDGTLRNPLHGDMNGWWLRADGPTDAAEALDALANARAFRSAELGGVRDVYWVDGGLRSTPEVRCAILDHWTVSSVERSGLATLLRLEARTALPPWTVIHEERLPAPRWLRKDAPFGSGCNLSMDRLRDFRGGSLILDVEAAAPEDAEAVIVVERKFGERTTDYRSLPIARKAKGTSGACYAVVAVDELYRPNEELKIYMWSHRGDSLSERGLRVRATPEKFNRW
jgi:hypothetical protein